MRLLLALAALLLLGAPPPALAHGDEQHGAVREQREQPSTSAAPSCPWDSPLGCACPHLGFCTGGAKLPALAGSAWHPLVTDVSAVPVQPGAVHHRPQPRCLVLARAPPSFS